MLSPPASLATHRSLDFHVLEDPDNRELSQVNRFVSDHYSTGKHEILPSLEQCIVFCITFASDASLVAVARAEFREHGDMGTVAHLSYIVVHSSHRQCGFGSLVLSQILADVTKRGALLAIASLDGINLRATSKLFQRAGFEKSEKLGYIRYLDMTSAANPRNSPVKTGQPDPGGLAKQFSSPAKHPRKAKNISLTAKKIRNWDDISIEYWVHGTARKRLSIAVPTYHEAVSMVSRDQSSANRQSTNQNNLHHLAEMPKRCAELLCSLRSVSPEHRVSVSLSDILGLKICEKWWFALQHADCEEDILKKAETLLVDEKTGSPSTNTSGVSRQDHKSSQSKSSHKNINSNDESNIIMKQKQVEKQMREKLRLQEQALMRAKDTIQKLSAKIQSQDENRLDTSRNRSLRNNINLPSGEKLTKIQNNSTDSNSSAIDVIPVQTTAALVRQKVENEIGSDHTSKTLQRPGGVRIDIVDSEPDLESRIVSRLPSKPMRSFLEAAQSEYARPFASQVGSRKEGKHRAKNRPNGSVGATRQRQKSRVETKSARATAKSETEATDITVSPQVYSKDSSSNDSAMATSYAMNTPSRLHNDKKFTDNKPLSNRKNSLEQYSISTLREVFEHIDKDGDGAINVREIIIGLRKDAKLSSMLHLPQRIKQEDGSRAAFEEIFQEMDQNGIREINWKDFCTYVISHQDRYRENDFNKSSSISTALPSTDKMPSASELRRFLAESSTQTPTRGPQPAASKIIPTTVEGALDLMSLETEDLDITLEALAARHEVQTLTLTEEEERIAKQEKHIMDQLAVLDAAESNLKSKRAKLQQEKARQRTEVRRQKQKVSADSKALVALETELVESALVL